MKTVVPPSRKDNKEIEGSAAGTAEPPDPDLISLWI
jgi:hypothetical protein